MASAHSERRLAAIMFTDIVGYTALMARDEAAGRRARARHEEVVRPLAERYGGQIVDENGDELVLSFPSALAAVRCALAVQDELRDDAELELRVGIHLGDIVFEGGRVYGDGVNVASRIRPFAAPGGICISEQVHDSIKNQPSVMTRSLGRHLRSGARAGRSDYLSGRSRELRHLQPGHLQSGHGHHATAPLDRVPSSVATHLEPSTRPGASSQRLFEATPTLPLPTISGGSWPTLLRVPEGGLRGQTDSLSQFS